MVWYEVGSAEAGTIGGRHLADDGVVQRGRVCLRSVAKWRVDACFREGGRKGNREGETSGMVEDYGGSHCDHWWLVSGGWLIGRSGWSG